MKDHRGVVVQAVEPPSWDIIAPPFTWPECDIHFGRRRK